MKLTVGNFKMNLLKGDIVDYLIRLKGEELNNVVFCPTSIYLNDFLSEGYVVGSQDVSFAEMGAYTGDISVKQLKSLGCSYSIVGHSERRKFYQDDKVVNKKMALCLENGLIPILCIGETLDEYDEGITKEVLIREIDEALNEVTSSDVIIAYEPIWAIGTGKVPTNDVIYDIIDFIKEYVYNKYKFKVRVLYGGSVSNKNIMELEKITNIDGYLVGGCSTKANDFCELVKLINKN